MKRKLRKIAKMCMLALVYSMIGVFGAITLPTNPSTSSASVGKDFILHINTGTAQTPTWTEIGGQRGSSLSRSADSIDVSHKTSGGWKSSKAGLRGWSIDLDGLFITSDTGLAALEQAFMTGVEVNVMLEFPDFTQQSGWGSITDFSLDTPHDGEASIKGTIEGNGALSSRVPSITPTTATVSTASCDDQTFTITPTATTVSSVKDNGVALTVTTDYTYSAGSLLIKDEYLEGKAIGVHTFTVTTGDGAILTILITVTA